MRVAQGKQANSFKDAFCAVVGSIVVERAKIEQMMEYYKGMRDSSTRSRLGTFSAAIEAMG
jgi:hypothetical protein